MCSNIEIKIYYIDTDEIPGFFLLLKNHILIARSEDTRDFKIQRRGRDESRPEVKIPKMTTTAHDRDVNKPRPCSRRTR